MKYLNMLMIYILEKSTDMTNFITKWLLTFNEKERTFIIVILSIIALSFPVTLIIHRIYIFIQNFIL